MFCCLKHWFSPHYLFSDFSEFFFTSLASLRLHSSAALQVFFNFSSVNLQLCFSLLIYGFLLDDFRRTRSSPKLFTFTKNLPLDQLMRMRWKIMRALGRSFKDDKMMNFTKRLYTKNLLVEPRLTGTRLPTGNFGLKSFTTRIWADSYSGLRLGRKITYLRGHSKKRFFLEI